MSEWRGKRKEKGAQRFFFAEKTLTSKLTQTASHGACEEMEATKLIFDGLYISYW